MPHSDPALILAIRQEIDQANRPIHQKLDEINSRLGKGDTHIALMEQRINDIDDRCPSRNISTEDHHAKKKEMNPFALAAITAVITTAANMTFLWWLTGVGQHASKGG